MEHLDKIKAIQFIRPNAEFILNGDSLEWLDKTQIQPTENEIQDGWLAYQEKTESDKAEAAATKAALLAKLGITEEEAKLLLS